MVQLDLFEDNINKGEDNLMVKKETFSFLRGDFAVEATVVETEINGEIDYTLEDLVVYDSRMRIATPYAAGVEIADIIREYEISKELMQEDSFDWEE